MKIKGKIFKEVFLYSLPAVSVIIFVFVYPIIKVIQYSFNRVSQNELTYIGFENYRIIFSDETFLISLKNNFLLLSSVPILIILSIFFAILLYEKIWGWKFYRFILFLPFIISIPVVGIIFFYIFQLKGLLNTGLEKIGLDILINDWLGSSRFAFWTVMFIIIWKELGFGIVILFARMTSINRDLYESAELDGASWIRKHIHVTIPQIKTVLTFLTIIYIITMLSWVFNYFYIITKGGPNVSTMVTEYYIYLNAFRYNIKGIASAASVVLFLVTFIFIIIRAKFLSSEEVG